MIVDNVTLRDVYTAVNDLRDDLSADIKDLRKEVGGNTAFINNLSGKIAMGVLAIGSFISIATAVIVSYINNKLFPGR